MGSRRERVDLPGDILAIRSVFVTFYVLRRADALYLIDTGFVGGRRLLKRALRDRGWDSLPIAGIILTHGHIDHIYNTAALARETGAWIAAPRLDERHCAGRYPYRGIARVCGWLEALGRKVLSWEPFTVDRWFDDGTEFPECGLTAVSLPGHTAGHAGLLHTEMRQLFSADLVASLRSGAVLPPAIFNSEPEKIPASVVKALTLPLDGILPCHGSPASTAEHLARLRRLRLS